WSNDHYTTCKSMDHSHMITSRRFFWLVVLACIAVLGPAAYLLVRAMAPSDVEQRDSHYAAATFADKVEAFIAGLPVERETFVVRLNRCDGARGEMRDDIYYVWIGARLVAENDDAGSMLHAVADEWRARGWTVFRERLLDNGGVNIGAVDPSS